MDKIKKILGTSILLLSFNVHALLIDQFDFTVLDTNTNLSWLNFSETFGSSVGDVTNQFGSGGLYEGFRYATNNEVVSLWNNNFGIDLTRPWGEFPALVDMGVSFADIALSDGVRTLEISDSPFSYYGAWGFTNEIRDDGSYYFLGASTRASDTDYFTTGYIESIDTVQYESLLSQPMGSYLVRSVPEPSVIVLIFSGLIGLGFARWKTRQG